MATTSIRMNDELKARLTVAAARVGKTPHTFILDAVTQAVEQAEQDHAFHKRGQERWQAIQATGQTVPWDQAKAHLAASAQGASEQALQDLTQLFEKLGLVF